MGVMYPCVISLVLAVFSMITLLVSSTNQASSDMLTNTIIVDTNTLDDIYRNKGYKI